MALNPEITRQIDDIRHDSLHGASWLSRRAMTVIGLAIVKSEADTVSLFLEDLKETGRGLVESKPSMASVANCVSRLIYEIYRESGGEKDLPVLKNLASLIGRDLIKAFEEAFQKTARQGAGMIGEGDKLITCSYSSTVCQAIRMARLGGKDFSVMVSESRFGEKVYGEITSEEIRSYGIEVEIVADTAIRNRISGTNKALVGADSVLPDGSVINGVPAYHIALAAKESSLPFFALSEKIKLDARSYLGRSGEVEEGFDLLPPRLITGIITEEGIMNRVELIKNMKEMAGYLRVLY